MTPTVVISRRGADRVRAGHPWIYQSDIVEAEAESGDLVRVREERRRGLGWGLWSSQSQIALRMMVVGSAGSAGSTGSTGSGRDDIDERALFESRLRQAIDYRATLAIDGTACRLVHGEADRLPALIVDKYGDASGEYLVLQTLCQGMDRRAGLIVELLHEIVGPRGVLARNDPKVRRLEGLEERIDVLAGEIPETVAVREGDVTFQRGSSTRTEDRAVSRSARKPRRRGQLRGRPRARRVHLQRRLRAASGAPVRVGRSRSTRRRRPWR